MWFLFFLRDFVAVPAILVGIFTLIGALIQRTSFTRTVLSVFKVIIGFLILSGGAGVLVGSLAKFQPVFEATYGLSGVIPNNDALAGAMAAALPDIVSLASVIMIVGMILNLVLAVTSRLKYVYLSGHVLYYTSISLAVILYVIGVDFTNSAGDYAVAVLIGAAMMGMYMVVSPAVQQRYMKQILGTDEIGLGHTGGFGYALSGYIGERFSQLAISHENRVNNVKVDKRKYVERIGGKHPSWLWKPFAMSLDALAVPANAVRRACRPVTIPIGNVLYKIFKPAMISTEHIKFPKGLYFLRNTLVSTSITVFVFYCFAFLPGGILYELGSSQITPDAAAVLSSPNWLVTMIVQAFTFTAGVEIILTGVRMFVGELVPMFKGISEKLVKNSKAAVDCPVVFPYAPNAVLIGFISSFIAGLLGMGITIGMNQAGALAVVILPGLVPHFFLGATAGVFGNVKGGILGAIIGPAVGGIIITFVPVIFVVGGWVPVSSTALRDLVESQGGTTAAVDTLNWGDTDYIIGALPGLLGLAGKYVALGVICGLYVLFMLDGLYARWAKKGPYAPKPAEPVEQAETVAAAAPAAAAK